MYLKKASGLTLIIVIILGACAYMIDYMHGFDESAAYVIYSPAENLPPDMKNMHDIKKRKELFIDTLLPLILKSNKKVEIERARIMRIRNKGSRITLKDKKMLNELSDKYRVKAKTYKEQIHELLLRVDTLPVSLVLAQAAIESGWGTSRFAYEGNNIFGLRSFSRNSLRPIERKDGVRVSVFKNLQSCVDYHLFNINIHPLYKELRILRHKMDTPYDPIVMSYGLKNFSEQGRVYVNRIQRLIMQNKLKRYDTYRLYAGTEKYNTAVLFKKIREICFRWKKSLD